MHVAYYFDFSCPYAYLGATQIEALCDRISAQLEWRPMLLGGVFRARNTPQNMGAGMPAAKARHNLDDMQRWAKVWSIPLRVPNEHPMRTVAALRTLLATPRSHWTALIHGFYRAYWVDDLNIADETTIQKVLARAGIDDADAARVIARAASAEIKQELFTRTQEAVDRGVFGAPSVVVRSESGSPPEQFFWGQDRLHMVEAMAHGWSPANAEAAIRSVPRSVEPSNLTVDFWYDFASPFAYLAATQIEASAKRMGARLRWRPMLLGAIFRQLGTANVPLLAMNEAKQKWVSSDLLAWAAYWGVPFQFTSHFPVRTVAALRIALLAGDHIAQVSHALFRALWVENRDIANPLVLVDIANQEGLPGDDLVAQTQSQEVKQQLIDNTAEAIDSGVFGTPTYIAHTEDTKQLFWGQDRLDLMEKLLGEATEHS